MIQFLPRYLKSISLWPFWIKSEFYQEINTIYSGLNYVTQLYIVYKNLINGVLHNYTHQRQFQYENTVRMPSEHKMLRVSHLADMRSTM